MIEKGFCQCGCGGRTKISQKTSKRDGQVRGEPLRFIFGHQSRAELHHAWNGGTQKHSAGYVVRRKDNGERILEHRSVAEKALGKPLPPSAVVHHFGAHIAENGKNLVVCEDQAYHLFLHRRERAYQACGHADWRKCPYCKIYDDPKNMNPHSKGRAYHHGKCINEYHRLSKIKRGLV